MSESEVHTRGIGWPVWVGLALIGMTALAVLVLAALRLGRASAQPLPVYGQIADFTLTNQDGSAVSLADLRGQVWVADIIFTRCAGPCLKMTRQMKELQEALPPDSQAKLVTLTTDAGFRHPAGPEDLRRAVRRRPRRWMFLTGTKQEIAEAGH